MLTGKRLCPFISTRDGGTPWLKLELELKLPKNGHPMRAAREEVLESYEHPPELGVLE